MAEGSCLLHNGPGRQEQNKKCSEVIYSMDFALGTAFLQVGPTLLSFHNLFKKVHIGTIYSKQELLVDTLIFNTQQKYFLYIDIKHKMCSISLLFIAVSVGS